VQHTQNNPPVTKRWLTSADNENTMNSLAKQELKASDKYKLNTQSITTLLIFS
jgi:hypothetical protein